VIALFRKKTLRDTDVAGKRVLVRVDFNVPIKDGRVEDDSRIRAVLPTLNYLIEKGARLIVMSHLGRPKNAEEKYRLDPVAEVLSLLLNRPVEKVDKTVGDEVKKIVEQLEPGEILLLENLRFNPGEKANDPGFARSLAELGDIYVNDAFGAAHRAHASVVGIAKYIPAVAGFLLEKEVTTLSKLLEEPKRPFLTILGGSKVSDKVGVIDRFLDIVDVLLIGGGMCFTFLKAQGINVGRSILEEHYIEYARNTLTEAKSKGIKILLPEDVVISQEFNDYSESKVVPIDKIPPGWIGLDIGPKTIEIYKEEIAKARTIFWNGPMGVFELEPFAKGTEEIAKAIAESDAISIAGGGDTDAALRKFGLEEKVSFISTGGGASLKMLEGSPLPGVEVLDNKER
jgi:phosphoglycerate kinase